MGVRRKVNLADKDRRQTGTAFRVFTELNASHISMSEATSAYAVAGNVHQVTASSFTPLAAI